jgi:hypothetical protein
MSPAREPGRDPDLLDAEQQQRRPQQVDELRGEEQRAKGSLRGQRFGGQADGEVSDEHA